jgi:hypothetical protein
MSDTSKSFIAVSGKSRDVGVLVVNLRTQKIPFSQALVFRRKPVIKIPQTYAAQLQIILDQQRGQHPIELVNANELLQSGEIFWVMVVAAIGILSIAWGRYFIHKFLHR